MDKSEKNIFFDNIEEAAVYEKYYGRLNDPTCSASVKGICGDEMEYYLVIDKNIIKDIRFWTSGCESSKACGIILAYFAVNRNINEALKISPSYIINELKELQKDHHHCAILACITFYKAIGEYLVNYNNS